MRTAFNRKLITPILMALGLFSIIGGGSVDNALFWYGAAFAYWFVRGWWERRQPRRPSPTAPQASAPFTAQVAANAARAGQSDGAPGAFSRLDPVWRDWLRREVDTRPDCGNRNSTNGGL